MSAGAGQGRAQTEEVSYLVCEWPWHQFPDTHTHTMSVGQWASQRLSRAGLPSKLTCLLAGLSFLCLFCFVLFNLVGEEEGLRPGDLIGKGRRKDSVFCRLLFSGPQCATGFWPGDSTSCFPCGCLPRIAYNMTAGFHQSAQREQDGNPVFS
jgi:hypothetical protein